MPRPGRAAARPADGRCVRVGPGAAAVREGRFRCVGPTLGCRRHRREATLTRRRTLIRRRHGGRRWCGAQPRASARRRGRRAAALARSWAARLRGAGTRRFAAGSRRCRPGRRSREPGSAGRPPARSIARSAPRRRRSRRRPRRQQPSAPGRRSRADARQLVTIARPPLAPWRTARLDPDPSGLEVGSARTGRPRRLRAGSSDGLAATRSPGTG